MHTHWIRKKLPDVSSNAPGLSSHFRRKGRKPDGKRGDQSEEPSGGMAASLRKGAASCRVVFSIES